MSYASALWGVCRKACIFTVRVCRVHTIAGKISSALNNGKHKDLRNNARGRLGLGCLFALYRRIDEGSGRIRDKGRCSIIFHRRQISYRLQTV